MRSRPRLHRRRSGDPTPGAPGPLAPGTRSPPANGHTGTPSHFGSSLAPIGAAPSARAAPPHQCPDFSVNALRAAPGGAGLFNPGEPHFGGGADICTVFIPFWYHTLKWGQPAPF
jgi:hypothetical protein